MSATQQCPQFRSTLVSHKLNVPEPALLCCRPEIIPAGTVPYHLEHHTGRESKSRKERLEPLLKRLERSTAYLEAARETVSSCPKIFGETAAEVSRSALGFIDEMKGVLSGEFPEEKKRIESACKTAQEAFEEPAVVASV